MSLDDRALVACAAAVWKCRAVLRRNRTGFAKLGQAAECDREIEEFRYAEDAIERELAMNAWKKSK